jgi:hypothetical protein
MITYTAVIRGRNTRDALGEQREGKLQVQAWDRGQARQELARRVAARRLRIGGEVCDEVTVVSLQKLAVR